MSLTSAPAAWLDRTGRNSNHQRPELRTATMPRRGSTGGGLLAPAVLLSCTECEVSMAMQALFRKHVIGDAVFRDYCVAERTRLMMFIDAVRWSFIMLCSLVIIVDFKAVLHGPLWHKLLYSVVLFTTCAMEVRNRRVMRRQFWRLVKAAEYQLCTNCGYILLGHHLPRFSCPECGTPSTSSELERAWKFWALSRRVWD